jgi:hypothetical protein
MTNDPVFVIDDTLGISDNLAAFAQLIGGMDAPLGAALKPHLSSLAAGQQVDATAIWNALFAATETSNAVSNAGEAEGAA